LSLKSSTDTIRHVVLNTDTIHEFSFPRQEIAYAEKLREHFVNGILNLSEEEKIMTLRGYLAMKLGCQEERICAKFKGANSLSKTAYRVNVDDTNSVEAELAR